jgi:hypothetical protein
MLLAKLPWAAYSMDIAHTSGEGLCHRLVMPVGFALPRVAHSSRPLSFLIAPSTIWRTLSRETVLVADLLRSHIVGAIEPEAGTDHGGLSGVQLVQKGLDIEMSQAVLWLPFASLRLVPGKALVAYRVRRWTRSPSRRIPRVAPTFFERDRVPWLQIPRTWIALPAPFGQPRSVSSRSDVRRRMC